MSSSRSRAAASPSAARRGTWISFRRCRARSTMGRFRRISASRAICSMPWCSARGFRAAPRPHHGMGRHHLDRSRHAGRQAHLQRAPALGSRSTDGAAVLPFLRELQRTVEPVAPPPRPQCLRRMARRRRCGCACTAARRCLAWLARGLLNRRCPRQGKRRLRARAADRDTKGAGERRFQPARSLSIGITTSLAGRSEPCAQQDEERKIRITPDQVDFPGPIVIIGFGSIGKGALPLILRHIRAPRENMRGDRARRLMPPAGRAARACASRSSALRPDNYRNMLTPLDRAAVSSSTCRSTCPRWR